VASNGIPLKFYEELSNGLKFERGTQRQHGDLVSLISFHRKGKCTKQALSLGHACSSSSSSSSSSSNCGKDKNLLLLV